ncbi:hypothetical protein BJ742DRAFT_216390 [Cladochytrium replicatum]|nr:hypothetical protein BJ742DRAFT_216390 [Cladochytrium replicatum]
MIPTRVKMEQTLSSLVYGNLLPQTDGKIRVKALARRSMRRVIRPLKTSQPRIRESVIRWIVDFRQFYRDLLHPCSWISDLLSWNGMNLPNLLSGTGSCGIRKSSCRAIRISMLRWPKSLEEHTSMENSTKEWEDKVADIRKGVEKSNIDCKNQDKLSKHSSKQSMHCFPSWIPALQRARPSHCPP